MAFKLTKEDLKKSVICPPGMHLATLIEVEEEYLSEKGVSVQPTTFETDQGYQVRNWFNDRVMGNLFEFVEAADKIKFNPTEMEDTEIDLKDYVGRRVAISVSHRKDKNNKIQAQIDNFFNADKVPF